MKLGVIPTISPFLLPRVLPTINEKHPTLRLYLREEQIEQLLSCLHAGEIDLALIALPYDIEGLPSRIILEDKFQFACNASHSLANNKTVPLGALVNEPLMLLEEGHCLRGHALDACQFYNFQIRAQFEASSLHTLVQMVASGIGVTLLPELAIDSHITNGTSIKLVPLSNNASRQIGLVWRQSSLHSRDFEIPGDTLENTVTSQRR
jgi:LysR family hydrogen peroxide-inducible transcriptional activator